MANPSFDIHESVNNLQKCIDFILLLYNDDHKTIILNNFISHLQAIKSQPEFTEYKNDLDEAILNI